MESFGTLHVFLPAAAACVLAVLPSCGKFALGAFDGRMRRLTDRPAPVPEMPSALPDTSVFVSAVRYDPGYNWIKDSLHGSVDFDIVLYDDGVPLLTVPVPAGAPFSASPDTHHIIDGSLYTEFPAAGGTVICRDGMEILRLGSGERLLGLIPAQDGLYSLTVRHGGDGFVLRRNQEVLLSRGVGTVFGSFGEPSYGTTGALYRDGGSICFAYRETGGRVFTVRDGNESVVLPDLSGLYAGEMLDVKVGRGRTAAGYSRVSGLSVEGTRVWPCPDGSFFLTCTVCGPDACSAALPYGVAFIRDDIPGYFFPVLVLGYGKNHFLAGNPHIIFAERGCHGIGFREILRIVHADQAQRGRGILIEREGQGVAGEGHGRTGFQGRFEGVGVFRCAGGAFKVESQAGNGLG